MAMARYSGTIQDLSGNAIQSGTITVVREGVGMEPLYADRDGTVPLGNPVVSDSDGSFFFHARGGAFRLEAIGPGVAKIIRYVAVGLGGESDFQGLNPRGLYNAGNTYELADMVRAGSHLFASRVDNNIGNTPDSTTPGDTAFWMYLGPIAGVTEEDVLAALGITGVIISEDNPSGGIDGNLWLQV